MTAILERVCEHCSTPLVGKRSDARYCDRRCKTRASDRRRVVDGREQARNLARYPSEAEKRRADVAAYQAANRERMRVIRLRRRGRIRQRAFLVTDRDWMRLVRRYDGHCAYCGIRPQKLTRDHVIPLARGGRHSIGNLLPACAPCNFSKRTRLLSEWRRQRLSEGVK